MHRTHSHSRSRSPRRPGWRAAFGLAVLALAGSGCSSETDAAVADPDDVLVRARVAACYENRVFEDARKLLSPLVERPKPEVQDLVRMAAIELRLFQNEPARALIERALTLEPKDAAANYVAGRMDQDEYQLDQAIAHFQIVLDQIPEDLPTRVCMASALDESDRGEEAIQLYEEVLEVGVDNGGVWFVTALYRLANLKRARGENADDLQALFQRYEQAGWKAASGPQLDAGNLGGAPWPDAPGSDVTEAQGPPVFESKGIIAADLAGARRLEAHDLDANRLLDLVASGDFGLRISLFDAIEEQVHGPAVTILEEEPDAFALFDLAHDDDLDFVVARGGTLTVIEAREDPETFERSWVPLEIEMPTLPDAPSEILPADFDHDGDLDLICVGSFGARIARCDGAGERPEMGEDMLFVGSFGDATPDSGMPMLGSFEWCLSEDFDSDQDVDFLLGGPAELFLADNLRGGRFADGTAAAFGDGGAFAHEPLAADFNADARPDLLVPGAPAVLWTRRVEGGFEREETPYSTGTKLVGADLDLNAGLDVAWPSENALLEVALDFGLLVEQAVTIAGEPSPDAPWIVCDLDRDLRFDVLRGTAEGVEVLSCTSSVGGGSLQQWLGTKDNRQGVGAIVEVRAGHKYRRIYWRGAPELIGVGAEKWIDVVRVLWPNGVVQQHKDWELGSQIDLELARQPEGLVGSCPFLYTWNGTTFEFISDVLGITPLGLPMGPGMLVPPDHDEYVLVRGDQMVPRDGFLELQFTEELREVTYLDRLRVEAVDHPVGTEIYPDERFTFPPFPEPHTHSVRAPISPLHAAGSDGTDWAEALAEIDDQHAVPFEPLHSQFLGLATPHWIELEFDAEALRSADKLRLLMTGWLYWTDASVNMAAARTPGVEFVPPILETPGEDGEWIPIGPPVGFPAGKTKTMVIDLSEHLRAEDPRVRVSSTLRLYWDAIRLATDGDDAELRVTSLEPASAELWERGFSAPLLCEGEHLPERFDWDVLADMPRWNQHPGMYTRFGECLELLEEIDDRFVIMGSGDSLLVKVDVRELAPPAPGFERDWLVFLDGWAKDRDPNTVQALEVEPLPFHGMSGYPYGAEEGFPDDDEHRAWRREWNTRAARDWIVPLAPRREVEWIQSALLR